MIFDVHDFHTGNHRLDLLTQLKDANPRFKLTAFAVPALCTPSFLASLPPWIELQVHGWQHPHPREASHWTKTRTEEVMFAPIVQEFMGRGWCSPGWQISDGTYQALHEHGWFVEDQPYNDHRRPEGLLTHRLGDGHHVHCHVQDECGNGLQETLPTLLQQVADADEFLYISETVTPWQP